MNTRTPFHGLKKKASRLSLGKTENGPGSYTRGRLNHNSAELCPLTVTDYTDNPLALYYT